MRVSYLASAIGSELPGLCSQDQRLRFFPVEFHREVLGELPGRDAIVIAPDLEHVHLELLHRIRSNPEHALIPVFLHFQGEHVHVELSDGVIHHATELWDRINEIEQHFQQLPTLSSDSSIEERLLQFLFTRPSKKLQVKMNWQKKQGYEYPLVSLFLGENLDVECWPWLNDLYHRNLLSRHELRERLYYCSHCEAAHINYNNRCPECHSINIGDQQFLHCFTCGTVAPQDEFLQAEKLICTCCSTRLRHIGVDYDRALENELCYDCRAFFRESELIAKCMLCGFVNSPDQMASRAFYDFSLSSQARFRLHQRLPNDAWQAFDKLRYLDYQYFKSMLDWSIALQRRYKDNHFGLMRIQLTNLYQLQEELGSIQLSAQLDKFASQLKRHLRSTDLTSRNEEQHFWFILPRTDKAGCQLLAKRIQESQKISMQIDFLSSEEVDVGEVSADLMVAQLNTARG